MIVRECKRSLLEWSSKGGTIELFTRRRSEESDVTLDHVERATTPKNASFLFCSQFVVGCWGFVLRLPYIL